MTIYAISHVRAVFAAALQAAPDRESAVLATAQSLGLPVEAVRQAVDQEAAQC